MGFYFPRLEYEDEDYEEGEGEEEEDNAETEKPLRREENSVTADETEPEVQPSQEKVPDNEEDEDEDEQEIPEVHKTDSEVVEVTTKVAPVDLCQTANGGCDHNCHFVREENDPEGGRVVCSCFSGFTLDDGDGRTCHGESLV